MKKLLRNPSDHKTKINPNFYVMGIMNVIEANTYS